MKDRTRKFALGAIFAAVAGYIAGILTAPKSGKQTRSDIKNTANATVAEAEKRLKKLHTELNDLTEKAKTRGNQLKGKAQTEFNVAFDKAKMAKQKAREMLSAVHEGGAEDKDLKKAVSDASSAVKHLKNYLKHDG